MHLESHYKVDPFLEFNGLKDVMDESSKNVDVLSSKFGRIFVVFLTMNSLSEDPNIYFQTDWKNVLLNLLSMKVAFKAIVSICNQKYFNNLVVTVQEEGFMDNISMQYLRAPKSLVRPKSGLSYSHNGIVRNLGHTPSF
jgi:hypothetical protein